MTEEETGARLFLSLDLGDEVDPDELDRQTRQLREELLDVLVESVDLVKTAGAPEGTKSVETVTLGALALAVLPEFIPKLVEYLQSWTMRAENRRVKVKTQIGDRSIELEYSPAAMSAQELDNLVDTLMDSLAEG